MKNIIYAFLMTAFLAGCGDDYVTLLPYGKTIPENTDDLAQMLNVTNDINSGGGNFGNQSDDVVIPEFLIPRSSVSTMNAYTWQDYMYQENEQDADWVDYYKTISRANFVIDNLDSYEEGTMYDIEDTRGRAHFIRANAFFYLVNGYAKHYNAGTASSDLGVPVPLAMDINVLTPRSTVQEVYDLILSDLDVALDALPDNPKHRTFAGKAAVHGLLGRLYLYQENYELSAEHSKKSLDFYSTLKDYNEIMYAVDNGDGDPATGNSAMGIINFDNNKLSNPENIYVNEQGWYRTELYLSSELVALFDPATDMRYWYFMSDEDPYGAPVPDGYYIATNDGQQPWSGIKTPEVLLNYCEALMKQATPNSNEAVSYLNMLREKRYYAASYSPYVHVDDATTLAEIMIERRKELRLTAWRWFDMKRLGLSHSRTVNGETFTISASSDNYMWAIPLNVIAINPLEQNPRGL
ncbi:RagB/SusD family nutrient uptake outer membrane protein [Carboxylicivirga sp. RSCT41]|uniref:RagB/SusD family nutrient uptake outer membrane protein n=1 Tax=Carboxylicivirga agarovorans TaxID=3417570 RepID=UPI003D325F07